VKKITIPITTSSVKKRCGFGQNLLLAAKKDIDDIADAVLKVYENREKLAKLDKTSSKYKKDSVAL